MIELRVACFIIVGVIDANWFWIGCPDPYQPYGWIAMVCGLVALLTLVVEVAGGISQDLSAASPGGKEVVR